MKRIRKLILGFALVSLLGALSHHTNAQTKSAAHLRGQHRELLNAWLEKKPAFRLAMETDCQNTIGLAATRQEYGAAYHPYYAVGDFNRDGQEDFAVALIDRQRHSRKFAIAIFNGPHALRPGLTPSFLTTNIDLSDGGLIVRANYPLIAGVFQSDDCVQLRPRGRTYIIRSCL